MLILKYLGQEQCTYLPIKLNKRPNLIFYAWICKTRDIKSEIMCHAGFYETKKRVFVYCKPEMLFVIYS
jgi:hypothetical protein